MFVNVVSEKTYAKETAATFEFAAQIKSSIKVFAFKFIMNLNDDNKSLLLIKFYYSFLDGDIGF